MSGHYLDGQRIEIPAHYDSWMMGDRFGVVVKVTRTHIHVTMDRSGRTRRFIRDDIEQYAQTVD